MFTKEKQHILYYSSYTLSISNSSFLLENTEVKNFATEIELLAIKMDNVFLLRFDVNFECIVLRRKSS